MHLDQNRPCKYRASKAMCRQPDIRTEIPEHTGRSSRHGISAPGRNAALSRVLKVPDRPLQTPQELHPPLADIRQIEPCAAMIRTPFQHGKRDTRNTIQYARPIQPSWRRRSPTSLPPAPRGLPSPASYRVDTETCRYSEYHATNKRSTAWSVEVGISMTQRQTAGDTPRSPTRR